VSGAWKLVLDAATWRMRAYNKLLDQTHPEVYPRWTDKRSPPVLFIDLCIRYIPRHMELMNFVFLENYFVRKKLTQTRSWDSVNFTCGT